MAPKAKPSAKVKKDEIIEVPKTAGIPDGKKTFFVGGWSSFESFRALQEITSQHTEAGDTVIVLPGEIDAGEGPLELRTLTVGGQSCFERLAAQRVDASKGGAEDEAGQEARALDGAEDGTKKTAAEDEKLDRSVVIKGLLNITAWKPPPPPVPTPVAPTPVAPAPKKSGASSKTVKIDEEPAPPPKEPDPPEVGVAPSTWPTVTFDGLCFTGSVVVKGIHAVFKRCAFASTETAQQLTVHQYCKVSVEQCTFDVPQRQSLYCFPKSVVSVNKCYFGSEVARERLPTDAASSTTAVYCDDASLQLTSSTMRNVGFGVVLKDKCEGTVVSRNTFDGIEATGLMVQGGCIAAIRSNTFKRCGYYAMQFMGDSKCQPMVVCNTVSSTVRIHHGARPTLHTNKLDVAVVDDNATSPAYLNPTY